jgi:hypothetical protein
VDPIDKSNPPKDILRSRYDLNFIRNSLEPTDSERVYFGLPAQGMLDVIAWREFIDRAICVDRDRGTLDAMSIVAQNEKLFDSCTFLRGDIETVLRNGRDDDNVPIPDWGFDIVNLDLEGALFQSDPASRLDAVDSLCRRQKEFQQSFVLFLTLGFRSVRRNSMDEVNRKLRDIEVELDQEGVDAEPAILWYLGHPSERRLKVYVPYAVEERARVSRFRLTKYLSYHYLGTGGVHMVHYAMYLEYSLDQVSPPRTSLRRLLTAPLYRVEPVRGAEAEVDDIPSIIPRTTRNDP